MAREFYSNLSRNQQVDRHALVLSFWFAFGIVAVALINMGFRLSDGVLTLLGFASIVVGFVAHIIINNIYATNFTPREIAFGLLIYSIGLIVFILMKFFRDDISDTNFYSGVIGFISVFISVIFYNAFESFDVIRWF
ncbi:MAG: hypothetical protein QGM50_05840 [Anaerolineae bacterium]|nr:hypothetical protein [Anaerolineae bacterium]